MTTPISDAADIVEDMSSAPWSDSFCRLAVRWMPLSASASTSAAVSSGWRCAESQR